MVVVIGILIGLALGAGVAFLSLYAFAGSRLAAARRTRQSTAPPGYANTGTGAPMRLVVWVSVTVMPAPRFRPRPGWP